jgi:hypothetical protein
MDPIIIGVILVAVILAIGGFAYKGAKRVDSRSSNPSGPKYLFSSQIKSSKSSPRRTVRNSARVLTVNNVSKHVR